MKIINYSIVVFTLICLHCYPQVAINESGDSADPSAGLDVSYTNKGFLPPRLTSTQINSINNPAEGLIIYNTTIKSPVYYNGTVWMKLGDQYYIGTFHQGGIIFYIDSTGQHGLISSASDLANTVHWGCEGTLIGGTSFDIGTGQANTTLIVAACSQAGIAARLCDELEQSGYDDWFLPSFEELHELWVHKSIIGGFTTYYYWSSSEYLASSAWDMSFYNGMTGAHAKEGYNFWVRCIRAF